MTLRRLIPWGLIFFGHLWLVRNSGILGDDTITARIPWSVIFALALALAVASFLTQRRDVMLAYVSVIVVIGATRSLLYANSGLANPLGVWVLVVGCHLLLWSEKYPSVGDTGRGG